MGSEKLCLSWNKYESNFSVAFQDLRQEKEFFDVTLACKDGQLEAHKVILSSCSTFFRDILKRNPHVHPLLYMKDVKLSHLQAVMDFMYQGNVNVDQKELDTFLALARELKVKGLDHDESPIVNPVKEMNYVQIELQNCLKLRKPEDLFKPKVLCNDWYAKNGYQEDGVASESFDTIHSNCACPCEYMQEQAVAEIFSERATAEDAAAGLGRQVVGQTTAVEETTGADVELGHSVGYQVGNLCSDWNWDNCRFGIRCKFEHRCSKRLQDGTVCEDQWHRAKNHH